MRTKLIEVCSVNNEHYYANAKIAESLKLCDSLVLIEGHEEYSGNPKTPSFEQYTSDKIK